MSTAQFFTFTKNGLFYKCSKRIDFSLEHEVEIAEILQVYNHRNLVKFIGLEQVSCQDENIEKFELNLNGPAKCSVWEFLKGELFADFFRTCNRDKTIINIIVQVFLTILELQDKCKFVHGDLHTENIFVVESDNKTNFDYIIDIVSI